MAFDPCRKWLGIDAVDLTTPHVVLGVDRDESSPLVITRAADERLAALRAVSPGPFEKAHAALLSRVAEARDQMLAAAASPTPPSPPGAGLSPPPPPRAGGLTAPPPPPGRPAVPPMVPVATTAPPAVPTPPVPAPAVGPPPVPAAFAADPMPPVPSFGEGAVRPADDREAPHFSLTRPAASAPVSSGSGSGSVFAAIALLAAMASGLGAYMYWTKTHRTVASHHAGPHAAGDAKHPADTPPAADPKHPAVAKPAAGDHGHDKPPAHGGDASHKDRATKDHAKADGGDEARKEAEHRRDERRRQAEEESRRQREQREKEAAEKARLEKERADSEMAERKERERAEKERAMAAANVEKSLRKAYAALRADDYGAATKAVDAAAMAAGDDADTTTRVERWRLLVNYAKQLVGFRDQAFRSASEGREYKIGNRVISIIEIDSTKFAYKESGQIKRGSRDSLPKAIERAILKQWFEKDGRAANHIFLGVQHLVDDTPNLRAVRAEWETALQGEPATKSLMPLLDDPILGGSGG